MKTLINAICILLVITLTACHSSSNEKKIGIIVPLQHKAMDEIVAGFTETLKQKYPQPMHIKVANAQGDTNLQRAIIQQMKDEHYDLIVPIGTSTTQMSAAMIPQQSIVSLAASITDAERKKRKVCNIAAVHDEISNEQLISFIHESYPAITQLTLFHSASDKVFPDVQEAIAAGKNFGIAIKPVMVTALSEMYTFSNSLPQNTQGIFVLKDSFIVSGISTLIKAAEKHHIPLITSDQGSVQDGAAIALGVHEREIGIDGATLAADILAGKSACSLPIMEMTKLTVFVNKTALERENQSDTGVRAAADKFHYSTEYVALNKGN